MSAQFMLIAMKIFAQLVGLNVAKLGPIILRYKAEHNLRS
jgi:hypothetical protein